MVVTVQEYERGLEYRRGRFQRILDPGTYRVWSWERRRIVTVDMREWPLQITGQSVLTADQIAVRLNILVRYRVVDPQRAVHEVGSYTDALHQAAQLAARDLVVKRSLEELLAQRAELGPALTTLTAQKAGAFGVQVTEAALKDVVLSNELRAAYEAKLIADQKGQAALIAARHQVAAARAEANAAKVLADNPAIFAHRQLEIMAKAAQGYGNHLILVPEPLADLARRLASGVQDGPGTYTGNDV